jgi:hypothetical protein
MRQGDTRAPDSSAQEAPGRVPCRSGRYAVTARIIAAQAWQGGASNPWRFRSGNRSSNFVRSSGKLQQGVNWRAGKKFAFRGCAQRYPNGFRLQLVRDLTPLPAAHRAHNDCLPVFSNSERSAIPERFPARSRLRLTPPALAQRVTVRFVKVEFAKRFPLDRLQRFAAPCCSALNAPQACRIAPQQGIDGRGDASYRLASVAIENAKRSITNAIGQMPSSARSAA